MKNIATQSLFRHTKNLILVGVLTLLFSIKMFASDDKGEATKLLPPPTPTVTQTLPTGANSSSCYTTLTATGCNTGDIVRWYTGNTYYGSGNSITPSSNVPLQLKAACYDGTTIGSYSPEYKVFFYNYTEVTPNSGTVCPGTSSVTLNASSAFSGLNYQWQKNYSNINGANNSTYTANNQGSYTVIASSAFCSTYYSYNAPSNIGVSTITGPDDSVSGSVSGSCGSQTMTLYAYSSSYNSYQWKLNGVAISGATSYSYSKTSPISEGTYTCDIVSGSCSFTTKPYYYTPSTAPTISFNAAVAPSCYTTLTATGCSASVYWYKNGSSSYDYITSGSEPYNLTSITTNTDTYTAKCNYGSCLSATSNSVTVSPHLYTSVTAPATTICPGSNVTLTANTTFTGVTYQWQKDYVDIAGATTSIYNATAMGTYRVLVSKGGCTYYNAIITITGPSNTLSSSISGTCSSQSMTLYTASSSYNSYQWKLDGVAISGATSYSYTKASPVPEGAYTCDVVAGSCTFTTQAFNYTPSMAPVISFNAAVAPSCYPTLTATGCPATAYWYKNGSSSYDGTSSGSSPYTLYSINNGDTYTAKCLYGSCYSPASNTATVTPNLYTSVTAPSLVLCSSGSITLTANSTFTGLTYQWQKSYSNISGATSSTYDATTTGSYGVIVSKSGCSYYSPIVNITTFTPPTLSISSTSGSSPLSIVNGQSVALTANGCTGGTITWSSGDSGTSITVSPSTNTTYTFNCVQSCTTTSGGFVINVGTLLPPTLTSSSLSTCTGTSVTLTASACQGGGIVTWSTTQTGQNISVSPSLPTNYTATCTVGSVTSANSSPISISVFDGAITSLSSGDWTSPATWSCNCVPAPCNDITVEVGHIVNIPVSLTGRLNNLTVKGSVDMKNMSTMKMK
jgi:hypothetical protein